jgi:hypothetical protein
MLNGRAHVGGRMDCRIKSGNDDWEVAGRAKISEAGD